MTNAYEKLYNNVKERLTVVHEGQEFNLGEYMLMQATMEKNEAALPVEARTYAGAGEKALALMVSYVNDKLTIKEPPVKDKTIRAFPFRASASALLSAVACCALVISIAVVGMGSQKHNNEMLDNVSMTDYYIEDAVELHREVV
jgi:hypothetical protein